MEEWSSSDYYDDNVHKIQLPYAQVGSTQKKYTAVQSLMILKKNFSKIQKVVL